MTDRIKYTPSQPFYLSRFNDAELTAVFAVGKLWFDAAPALSVSLGGNLHDELARRVRNTSAGDHPPHEPEAIDLHFSQWSDRDVADAVRLLTVASYVLTDAKVGELIDHLAATLADVAAARLAASGDERNEVHFVERNFPEQRSASDGNPEAN